MRLLPQRDASVAAWRRGETETSAGQLDVLLSGQPIWVIVGPVATGSRSAITADLFHLSHQDPVRRVGLVPTGASRSWTFCPSTIRNAVQQRPASMTPLVDSATGISETLNSLLRSDRYGIPMAVIPIGDFVAFRFDHGLGDAHVLMRIIAEVSASGAQGGGLPIKSDEPNVVNPALWALLNTARSNPGRLAHAAWMVLRDKALQMRVRSLRRSAVQAGPPGTATEDGERHCAVFVRSSSDFIARARRYRAMHHIDMSVSALTMYWIHRSLRAAGVPVSPVIEVLVDLRRYLPEGRRTWANFTAVARISVRPDTTPQQFGDMLSSHLNSTRPLVEMVAGVAKSRLLTTVSLDGGMSGWHAAQGSPTGEATVVFSDISRVPSAAHVNWASGRRPSLAVALPPASKSNISMLICSPSPGEIQVTASFFPSQFNMQTIRRSLGDALATPGSRVVEHTELRYGIHRW